MLATRQSSLRESGRPGWLLSFADLMMLLLTFFVLLFSVSNVDANKYRQLAESLEGRIDETSVLEKPPALVSTVELNGGETERPDTQPESLAHILETEIEKDMLDVEEGERRITIRFQERIAFPSGRETLEESFAPVLAKIGAALIDVPGEITVAGHTDDLPIANQRFRSNWELSTARAVSVVHGLLEHTAIDRGRISAVGYADTRPLVPNDTPDHRALNRRVEIRVDLADD